MDDESSRVNDSLFAYVNVHTHIYVCIYVFMKVIGRRWIYISYMEHIMVHSIHMNLYMYHVYVQLD